jgi:hypothetical protein
MSENYAFRCFKLCFQMLYSSKSKRKVELLGAFQRWSCLVPSKGGVAWCLPKVELLGAFQTGRRKRASTFYLVAGSREGTRNIKKEKHTNMNKKFRNSFYELYYELYLYNCLPSETPLLRKPPFLPLRVFRRGGCNYGSIVE